MERMKHSSMQFATYLVALTVGVALMVIGIDWLLFLGLALAVASGFFSSHSKFRPHSFTAVFIGLAGAVWCFVVDWHHGRIFVRQPVDWWFVLLLAGAWLWSVLRELRCWRANPNITQDA